MTFTRQVSLEPLAKQIDEIFRSCPEPDQATALVENCLEQAFQEVPPQQRVLCLKEFIDFYAGSPARAAVSPAGDDSLGLLVPLLLGKSIEDISCTPDELLRRLGAAMNTVFDSLNELQQAIKCSLLGQAAQEETIRLVIAANVAGAGEATRLQEYLDQIKEAFFIMYGAFREASERKVGELLAELDPERIAGEVNGGMKVGPFRKAEMFDLFEERHRSLALGLERGVIAKSLLRDFERTCQRLYAEKGKTHG